MKVYQVINKIQSDLAAIGISKDRKNLQQGYNFRGVDDVYNALAPLLSKHGLCILPRCLQRECVERTSKTGGIVSYVTVEAEFDFVCSEDNSKHTVKTFGEAMDTADKATNKAMSAAYKYAAFQAFCIPTEGDNDADASTYEIANETNENKKNNTKKPSIDSMIASIKAAQTIDELQRYYATSYRQVEASGDLVAMAKIIEAKDAAKKKIEGTTK